MPSVATKRCFPLRQRSLWSKQHRLQRRRLGSPQNHLRAQPSNPTQRPSRLQRWRRVAFQSLAGGIRPAGHVQVQVQCTEQPGRRRGSGCADLGRCDSAGIRRTPHFAGFQASSQSGRRRIVNGSFLRRELPPPAFPRPANVYLVTGHRRDSGHYRRSIRDRLLQHREIGNDDLNAASTTTTRRLRAAPS